MIGDLVGEASAVGERIARQEQGTDHGGIRGVDIVRKNRVDGIRARIGAEPVEDGMRIRVVSVMITAASMP
ncbi:MAG: hypothetical protein ACYCZY_01395 [Lacisediminihabitans sp.]